MKKTQILLTVLLTFNLVTCFGLEVKAAANQETTTKTDFANTNIDINESMISEFAQNTEVKTFQISYNTLDEISELRNTPEIRNQQKEEKNLQSRGEKESDKKLVGEFKLSFYTPSADETDSTPNITASGAKAKPGVTVAVDTRYWDMGTEFYIEGYGYVVAEDTGSAIKGSNRIDVCVETKDEAIQKGIQYRKVWVVSR